MRVFLTACLCIWLGQVQGETELHLASQQHTIKRNSTSVLMQQAALISQFTWLNTQEAAMVKEQAQAKVAFEKGMLLCERSLQQILAQIGLLKSDLLSAHTVRHTRLANGAEVAKNIKFNSKLLADIKKVANQDRAEQHLQWIESERYYRQVASSKHLLTRTIDALSGYLAALPLPMPKANRTSTSSQPALSLLEVSGVDDSTAAASVAVAREKLGRLRDLSSSSHESKVVQLQEKLKAEAVDAAARLKLAAPLAGLDPFSQWLTAASSHKSIAEAKVQAALSSRKVKLARAQLRLADTDEKARAREVRAAKVNLKAALQAQRMLQEIEANLLKNKRKMLTSALVWLKNARKQAGKITTNTTSKLVARSAAIAQQQASLNASIARATQAGLRIIPSGRNVLVQSSRLQRLLATLRANASRLMAAADAKRTECRVQYSLGLQRQLRGEESLQQLLTVRSRTEKHMSLVMVKLAKASANATMRARDLHFRHEIKAIKRQAARDIAALTGGKPPAVSTLPLKQAALGLRQLIVLSFDALAFGNRAVANSQLNELRLMKTGPPLEQQLVRATNAHASDAAQLLTAQATLNVSLAREANATEQAAAFNRSAVAEGLARAQTCTPQAPVSADSDAPLLPTVACMAARASEAKSRRQLVQALDELQEAVSAREESERVVRVTAAAELASRKVKEAAQRVVDAYRRRLLSLDTATARRKQAATQITAYTKKLCFTGAGAGLVLPSSPCCTTFTCALPQKPRPTPTVFGNSTTESNHSSTENSTATLPTPPPVAVPENTTTVNATASNTTANSTTTPPTAPAAPKISTPPPAAVNETAKALAEEARAKEALQQQRSAQLAAKKKQQQAAAADAARSAAEVAALAALQKQLASSADDDDAPTVDASAVASAASKATSQGSKNTAGAALARFRQLSDAAVPDRSRLRRADSHFRFKGQALIPPSQSTTADPYASISA